MPHLARLVDRNGQKSDGQSILQLRSITVCDSQLRARLRLYIGKDASTAYRMHATASRRLGTRQDQATVYLQMNCFCNMHNFHSAYLSLQITNQHPHSDPTIYRWRDIPVLRNYSTCTNTGTRHKGLGTKLGVCLVPRLQSIQLA